MRKLPAAAIVSAALHGVALAWVVHGAAPRLASSPRIARPTLPPAAGAPAAPDDTVTAIVLLDDHTPVAARAARTTPATSEAPAHAISGRSPAAAIATRPGGTSGGPGEEVPAGPGHSPLMTMRGGGGPAIHAGLSQEFVTSFLDHGKPAELPPPPTGELHPSGHGTFESRHPTFTAHVDADGTVKLHDAPDIDIHAGCLLIGCKMAFDDAIMRKYGIDPYARAKLQWLDETRDERAAIGLAHRKDVLAHASQYMQQNLAWLWAKAKDPADRRQALFEMWDEIAETGDPDLVRAGAAARAYLVGFIRAHLPAGSPDAFTPDELARLNAHRTSHAVFAPYE